MRPGFSCKEISALLGVHERSATDAVNPALRKVAVLLLADPVKFIETLLPFLRDAEQAAFERTELPRREQIATGRCDTSVIRAGRR